MLIFIETAQKSLLDNTTNGSDNRVVLILILVMMDDSCNINGLLSLHVLSPSLSVLREGCVL